MLEANLQNPANPEPSMRERQAQMPGRVDNRGQKIQPPGKTESRVKPAPPPKPVAGVIRKAAKKWGWWAAAGIGPPFGGGIIGYLLT